MNENSYTEYFNSLTYIKRYKKEHQKSEQYLKDRIYNHCDAIYKRGINPQSLLSICRMSDKEDVERLMNELEEIAFKKFEERKI